MDNELEFDKEENTVSEVLEDAIDVFEEMANSTNEFLEEEGLEELQEEVDLLFDNLFKAIDDLLEFYDRNDLE